MTTFIMLQTSYRPGSDETICPPPGRWQFDSRRGSTSVRGRVRSPHISGGRPAAGSQRAYSLGWDRQTDGSRYRLMSLTPTPGHDKYVFSRRLTVCSATEYTGVRAIFGGGWIDFARKIWGSARKMNSRTNMIKPKQDETRKLDIYIDCGKSLKNLHLHCPFVINIR